MSDVSGNRLSTSRREGRQIALLSLSVSLTKSLEHGPSPAALVLPNAGGPREERPGCARGGMLAEGADLL